MGTVQLADIYEPNTFEAAVDEAAIDLNSFIRSGIMATNPKLSAMASVGGTTGDLPFYHQLDSSGEPDYTTDDPDTKSTPDKITGDKMMWRLASMHKSWSTMDLSRELALKDPLSAITNKIGQYWATIKQRRLLASCQGILADNDANDSDDMFVSIYNDIATPLATNIISGEAILDARQTLGDHFGVISAIGMHSITFNTLNKQNLIAYTPNSRGEIDFPTYLNMYVLIDDNLPVTAGANSPEYLSVLFAGGAFDHGNGNVMKPSALTRDEEAGNGGGMDIVHSRTADIIHPYGYKWTEASVAGQSPTLAELASAANWDRVVDRKNVGIAFLKHNN